MKTADDVIKRLQWDPMLPKVNQQHMINELLRKTSAPSAGKILGVLIMMFWPSLSTGYSISSKI